MNQAAILNLEGISKHFPGSSTFALADVSFTLKEGELLGLVGPSGCGKTTLLRIIAGFESPSRGSIELAGRQIAGTNCWVPPEQRHTGMVFQDYALFPHLSIAENIAFGLENKSSQGTKKWWHQAKSGRKKIKQRVGEVLGLVGLSGLEKRYPHELSGGQQQRVALARALAPQPPLILLDEPLSNLDVQVRQRLRHEIRHILKQTGTSAIFVTHDQEEALAISDTIGVMSQGKLEQIGTPEEIYTQPASRFIAEFVTQANFLPAKREGDYWQTEIGQLNITRVTPDIYNRGELMLRQEDLILQPDEEANVIICDRQFLGREYRYCLETVSGKRLHARTTTDTQLPIGSHVRLSIASQSPQIFPDTSSTAEKIRMKY